MWLHGTAFVDGRKEHLRGYLRRIAAEGFVVVAPNYSLAPETSYPIPERQVLAALGWVASNAERFHMDASRVVLAGDSSGAQLAAQVAAIATDLELAADLAMTQSIPAAGIRGIALFGGLYDPTRLSDDSRYAPLLKAVGWAYTGLRDYSRNERLLARLLVKDRVTASFPPAFIAAGDADPLLRQSQDLTVAYIEADAPVDTYFPENRESPLPHDFQFQFELVEATVALERLTGFLRRVTQ
jgi:acetyl esterase/lipase